MGFHSGLLARPGMALAIVTMATEELARALRI
jgi:hypothetical protein